MTPERLLLAPLALGHLAIFVLIVNVTHAFGHREQTMARMKVFLLASYTIGSALLAWESWRAPLLEWSWPSLIYGIVCIITGGFIFPAVTAFLHFRPRPKDIEENVMEVDLTNGADRAPFIGTGKYSWMLRLGFNESFRLRKLEFTIAQPNLPPDLDGLTILHISDLHFASCFTREYFEAVISEAATMPADLVLFTGDLIDHNAALPWIEPLFTRLRGRFGTFSILGNHDIDHDQEVIKRHLEHAGFVDLEATWRTITIGRSTIALGGTKEPWGPPLSLEKIPSADYRIVLSHAPDLFYELARGDVDLMLSGHNHGGQVRLPLIGAVFMPSKYSRRFDRGFFRNDGMVLHVSQGVAGKHPIRYGCAPEISRLTLRSIPQPNPQGSERAWAGQRDQDLSLSAETR